MLDFYRQGEGIVGVKIVLRFFGLLYTLCISRIFLLGSQVSMLLPSSQRWTSKDVKEDYADFKRCTPLHPMLRLPKRRLRSGIIDASNIGLTSIGTIGSALNFLSEADTIRNLYNTSGWFLEYKPSQIPPCFEREKNVDSIVGIKILQQETRPHWVPRQQIVLQLRSSWTTEVCTILVALRPFSCANKYASGHLQLTMHLTL